MDPENLDHAKSRAHVFRFSRINSTSRPPYRYTLILIPVLVAKTNFVILLIYTLFSRNNIKQMRAKPQSTNTK